MLIGTILECLLFNFVCDFSRLQERISGKPVGTKENDVALLEEEMKNKIYTESRFRTNSNCNAIVFCC
jgi:hypothetical protein